MNRREEIRHFQLLDMLEREILKNTEYYYDEDCEEDYEVKYTLPRLFKLTALGAIKREVLVSELICSSDEYQIKVICYRADTLKRIVYYTKNFPNESLEILLDFITSE